MAQISIQDLTFSHHGAPDNLFEHVSLTLDTDWRLGFIGRNGRGKTTFLKLLRGEYEYRGRISSPVEFEYFPFPLPDLSTAREAAAALAPEAEPWRLERELSLLAVDPGVLERPLATLSGGERTKVLLAIMFLREGRFRLIDEPTTHLDAAGRAMLGEYLRRQRSFILVSHDRDLLDQCVDHVLSLNRADIELQKGNFSSWRQNRDYRDRQEQTRAENLAGEIKKLAAAARRSADWSDRVEKGKYGAGPVDRGFIGHQAARLMKRSQAVDRRRQTALAEKKELGRNCETRERLSITTARHPAGRLLTMNGLSAGYGGDPVVRNLDLTLDQGDRLLVEGPNGSGKSTLLKLVAGEGGVRVEAGLFRPAANLEVAYVPQEADFEPDMDLRGYIGQNTLDESRFKAILHKLGFEKRQFEGDLRGFSDGQKKKVLLAASLARPAHLHIWDEPLNFIDILSRIQIEELILEHQPTLLMVEHDRHFARKVTTKVVSL